MADRWWRRRGAVVLAVLAVGLVGCGGGGSTGAPPAPPSPAAAVSSPASSVPVSPALASTVPDTSLRVLQLNLCNSGIAGCFTGRSVPEGAAVLRAEKPDLVTLNEVCEEDVQVLERALADVVPGGTVTSAFQPHRNGRTGQDYQCRNGQRFGLGLLSRWPTVSGSATEAGVYPAQDEEDPEQRAWLCQQFATGDAADAQVALCTTHLAYTKREVASAQCQYLFGTVVAGLRAREGAAPLVVAGDLNLGTGDSPDLKACLPPGSALVDDGGQQHVVGTPELAVADFRKIPLRETDHVGLLVTLTGKDES